MIKLGKHRTMPATDNDSTAMELDEKDCNNNQQAPRLVSPIIFATSQAAEAAKNEKKRLDVVELKDKLFSISGVEKRDPASIECYDDFSQVPLVIYIKDLHFSYTRKEKLIQNLSINIAQGQIYGLLGPSGCGKSTVLKLVLGLVKPAKGKVLVYGGRPLTPGCPVPGPGVGYMPQELTLMANMTVGDVFMYYGRLNQMRTTEVGKRTAELVDFLQIPSSTRLVEQLSGGQQRRTSLGVALLHSPPLLILDEPTVGIDPVMRNKIWSYLHELAAKEGKTIVITTHYIEEARNANTIGLMRYGHLLAEANPDRLLDDFGMSTIEEVFLNLCERSDEDKEDENKPNKAVQDKKKASNKIKPRKPNKYPPKDRQKFAAYNGKRKHNFYFDWGRVQAIVSDSFNFMNSKFWTIMLAVILPTMQISLFHFSVGKPPRDMHLSIVNLDKSTRNFGQVLIDSFDPDIRMEHWRNISAAVENVEAGYSYAAARLDSNFTKCMWTRMRKGMSSSNETVDCSTIRVYTDNTYQFVIFKLALDFRDAFLRAIHKVFDGSKYNAETLNSPVKIQEFVYGHDRFSYQEFMTPGMYMALIYLAPLIVALFVYLEQKTYGHIDRSRACGAKPLEIIMAHFIINSSVLLVQGTLMMCISLIYFEAQNLGSLFLLISIVTVEGIAGVSLALVLGCVIREKIVALVAIYGLTVSLWFICGIFWPLENITVVWLQEVMKALPLTLPTETARNIMNRGWSLNHMGVLAGFGSAFAYCAVPLSLAWLSFKFN